MTKVQGPKHNELVLDSQNQIRIISDIRDRKQGEVESAEAGSSLASLTASVISRFGERPCLRKEGEV